jgi:hypothetical protein
MSAPARRHDAGEIPTGCPSGPPDLGRHQWITSSLGARGPVGTQAVPAQQDSKVFLLENI